MHKKLIFDARKRPQYKQGQYNSKIRSDIIHMKQMYSFSRYNNLLRSLGQCYYVNVDPT